MNFQTIKFLNTLKNASLLNSEYIITNSNDLNLRVAKALYKEGFIQSYKLIKNLNSPFNMQLVITLRYYHNKSMFHKLRIVSKPSKTITLGYEDISRLQVKKDILFLSTNCGILSAQECKEQKLGGIPYFIC